MCENPRMQRVDEHVAFRRFDRDENRRYVERERTHRVGPGVAECGVDGWHRNVVPTARQGRTDLIDGKHGRVRKCCSHVDQFDFVRHDPEGAVLVDSRAMPAAPAAGAALWTDPLAPHYVRSVGNRDLHVIAVELKNT